MAGKEVETKAIVPFENGQLVPRDFDGMYRIAHIMANSGMVPADYSGKTEMVFVAMQMGYEVGLTPMMAVQNIAVIEGKPTIYADGITGLLQSSSDLDDIEEYFEVDGERKDPSDMPLDLTEWPQGFKAVSIITRKGRQSPYRGTFSVADAMRMEKWGKTTSKGRKTVWMKHPARMLMWRARTFAARDGFSDVLKGLKIYEEVADYTDMENTNGKYEVANDVESDPFDDGFVQFCADAGFDTPGVKYFIEESAEKAGVKPQAILDRAYNNMALFQQVFEDHLRATHKDEESGQNVQENVRKDDETPFQDPDMDKVKEDLPAEKEDVVEESLSTPRIDLNSVMFKELSKMKIDAVDKDYAGLLDNYIEYVVETINANSSGQAEPMDNERLIDSWLNDGEPAAFVEFFLQWIESEEMRENESATSGDGGGGTFPSAAKVDPTDVKDAGPVDSGGTVPDEGPDSYIKEWAMMPGPKFKNYVNDHPEKFKGISSDEYSKARDKWVKLVYAREKIDWPHDPETKQEEIKFPDMNERQQLAAVRKKYPDEVMKSMEFRGMAQHVTTDDAAGIVIEDVKNLVGGGVLVK